VIQLSPNQPSTHYLLAQTYRKLGNKAAVQAEMDQFEKLKKAENERRRPSDALVRAASRVPAERPASAEAPVTH
ncbi:MAG TPA: hypothetical protein VFZ27_16955, partial [Terriglobia bacterium]|nr:hypothetical protein [Terriglobia bacterium]